MGSGESDLGVQLYNTLTRKKEPFVPLEEGRVKMYVCGVTVYDHCHLGHARAAIVFDVIHRYFEYRGYEVNFVCNFTDVDDKIIARARRLKVPIGELTEKFIGEYYDDMDALGVQRADAAPRATENVAGMIEMIEKLIEKGIAYEIEGNVYYDIEKFADYGKLSGRNTEELEAGYRIEPGEGKRNPLDFALWKAAKPGEPEWESPWGMGRPGWHIECSVMSTRHLGERFDIHGGGEDLVFPHHENEIAQSEGCFGHEWVRYWVHNGFVQINHEKMSKSKGNFFTIKAILEDHPAEVIRYFLLGTHYRHPVDYSDQVVADARKGLDRLYNVRLRLARSSREDVGGWLERVQEAAAAFRAQFTEAMDDDFNTAIAVASLFDFVRLANKFIDSRGLEKDPQATERQTLDHVMLILRELTGTLGLFLTEPASVDDGADEGLIGSLMDLVIELRARARKSKDFATADLIRDALGEAGIQLEDRADGTGWSKK